MISLKTLFYIVILIEGYVVLATELIAIRLLIPFVGNGTETIAIIIAAVLMPLALGYYAGGKYVAKKARKRFINIREKLICNLINATIILTIGLSYALLEIFFPLLELIGIKHRILQTTFYSCIFITYPVFLLGQTIPLISNYFSRQKLSEITGKMLCYSTIGSFCGSIISTLVLMAIIGVHNTVIVNIMLLVLVVAILSKKILRMKNILILASMCLVIFLNNDIMMQKLGIIANNNYSTIKIENVANEKDSRILNINRSNSSKYTPYPAQMFEYIKYTEQTFLPITDQAKSILVIGAGGFTLGLIDNLNEYTFVDIDSSLKDVAEKYLLKYQLGANKYFVAEPARAFLQHNSQKYDFIFVDAYSNVITTPSQLITKDFFISLKNTLTDNGVLAFNTIVSPNFGDRYSIKLDNTLRSVFPNINRQIIQPYNTWKQHDTANIIYSYFNNNVSSDIYTDDINSYFLDR